MVYNSNGTIHEILLERRDEEDDDDDDCGGGGVRTRPVFAARIGCRFVLVRPLLASFRASCNSSLPVLLSSPLLKACQQESNISMTQTSIHPSKTTAVSAHNWHIIIETLTRSRLEIRMVLAALRLEPATRLTEAVALE